MADAGVTQFQPPRPTMKRSFFSKAAAAPSQSTQKPEDDDTDLFRKSDHVFRSIVAEKERRRKEKKEKKAKSRAHDEGDDDRRESGASKKRRISLEDEEEDKSAVEHEVATPTRRTRTQSETPTKVRQPPRGLSSQYNEAIAAERSLFQQSTIVDLGDSDLEPESEHDELYTPPRIRLTPRKERIKTVIELGDTRDDDQDAEDEEYSKLVARARERMRRKDLEASQKAMLPPNSEQIAPSPSTPSDPAVSVLITSDIDGIKPLIVKILLSKKIKEVRAAWCGYNQLSEDQGSNVFMTWRGLRQWDITSLKRMLESVADVAVNEDGSLVSTGRGDGLTEDFSKVHLVATTQKLFDEAKKKAERKFQEPDEDADAVAGSIEDLPQEAALIPIVLRENGQYGELKIKVKSDTTFGRIVSAFVKSKSIPPEANVFLMYEGERLDADDMMKDSEIEEKDVIEVYVR